jgi:peptidoglycan/LPS O-acetylase OafA/YrhL
MMGFGARALLVILAVILFVVAALSEGENWTDFIAWGLAVFAASFVVDSLPLGNMGARNNTRDRV